MNRRSDVTERESWVGHASISVVPPADYWANLAQVMNGPQLERLRMLSDERHNEFATSGLPPPDNDAEALLERVAADGWLECAERQRCPNCKEEVTTPQAAELTCPHCNEVYEDHGGVITEPIYVRNLAPSRDVDWVVAIHGMNTAGAWQESFSWYLSTTWGRSVPVAVYKYGKIIAGVVMVGRRGRLRDKLRDKLAALRDEAEARDFSGKPDVIAHSFGTWLFGHLLEKELERPADQRLRFGRVILTGCILRPNFDWGTYRDAGLVDEVLNHYGSKDRVVPLAHAVIWDSGPSGRRGFDGNEVINIRAEGYGHSDLFEIDKFVAEGKPFQKRTGIAGEVSHLENAYKRHWRPFLTLPSGELGGLPDRLDPNTLWRPLPWLLRGTLFPVFALPVTAALIVLFLSVAGKALWEARELPATVLKIGGGGLASLLALITIVWLWRRLWN